MNQWNPYANQFGYNNGNGGFYPAAQGNPGTFAPQSAQPQGLPTFNRVVWAQGYEAAKSVPLSPGEAVMILDSEGDRFYIASAGSDGRPNPLRAFRFEKEDEPGQSANFVTRKEFDELKASLEALQAPHGVEKDDGR